MVITDHAKKDPLTQALTKMMYVTTTEIKNPGSWRTIVAIEKEPGGENEAIAIEKEPGAKDEQAEEPREQKVIIGKEPKPGTEKVQAEEPAEKEASAIKKEPGAKKAQKESRMKRQMGNIWRCIRAVPNGNEGRQFKESVESLSRLQCGLLNYNTPRSAYYS